MSAASSFGRYLSTLSVSSVGITGNCWTRLCFSVSIVLLKVCFFGLNFVTYEWQLMSGLIEGSGGEEIQVPLGCNGFFYA